MRAVAAIAIRVKTPEAFGIARSQRFAVGVDVKAEFFQGAAVLSGQFAAVGALLWHRITKSRGYGIERIVEPRPVRRAVGPDSVERTGFAFPASIGALLFENFIGAHAIEEIIAGVKFADVIETEPAPCAGSVEIARCKRRAKLASFTTAGLGTRFIARNAAMKSSVTAELFGRHMWDI